MEGNILLVEDDVEIREGLAVLLKGQGYEVYQAKDGVEGLERLKEHEVDLAIIDIMMPRMDGITMTVNLRQNYDFPVIFLSAKAEEIDKIIGLNMGADDYITKPFSYDLLLAKVNSQLRRAYGEYANKETGSTCGDCSFNKLRFTLKCKDKQIDLPKNEAILIGILFDSYPNVVSREKILSEIWDSEMFVEENTLNVTVSRVRKKLKELESDLKVITVRGMGYKVEYEG